MESFCVYCFYNSNGQKKKFIPWRYELCPDCVREIDIEYGSDTWPLWIREVLVNPQKAEKKRSLLGHKEYREISMLTSDLMTHFEQPQMIWTDVVDCVLSFDSDKPCDSNYNSDTFSTDLIVELY